MKVVKFRSSYIPNVNSFSLEIPMYSKILNVLMDNCWGYYNSADVTIIYEIDDSILIQNKSVYFRIPPGSQSSSVDMSPIYGYKYLTTHIDRKSKLNTTSMPAGISFEIVETKTEYHIFYDDRCLQEERDTKIQKIIE